MTRRKTIDLTPSWQCILPSILMVLENATTEEAKENMRLELRRMAEAADRWNDMQRSERSIKKDLGL